MTVVHNDVVALRLYCKTPGTDRLRKSAAAELRHLLSLGWRETHRTMAADHLVVRLERPVTKTPWVRHEREAEPRRRRG